MSHVRHYALCVTSWNHEMLEEYRRKLIEIGLSPTELTPAVTNNYRSFFVPSCGSKHDWPETEIHIGKINKAVEILDRFKYADGSNCIKLCTAVYGEFEG